jgi:hypothetical protein
MTVSLAYPPLNGIVRNSGPIQDEMWQMETYIKQLALLLSHGPVPDPPSCPSCLTHHFLSVQESFSSTLPLVEQSHSDPSDLCMHSLSAMRQG